MSNKIDITKKAIQEAISGNTYIGRLVSAEDLRGLPGNKIDVLIDGEVSMRAAVEVPVLPNPEDALEGVFYITPDGQIHYLADGEWKTIVADGSKIYRVHTLPTTDIDPQGIYIIDATEEPDSGSGGYTLVFASGQDFSSTPHQISAQTDINWGDTTAYIYSAGVLKETITTAAQLTTALSNYDIGGLIPFYRLESSYRMNITWIGYRINAAGVINGAPVRESVFIPTTASDAGKDGLVPCPGIDEKGKFLRSDGYWIDSRRIVVVATKRNFFDLQISIDEFFKDEDNLNIDFITEYGARSGSPVTVDKGEFYTDLFEHFNADTWANCGVYLMDKAYWNRDYRFAYGYFETGHLNPDTSDQEHKYTVLGHGASSANAFVGATALTNGQQGEVPAPSYGPLPMLAGTKITADGNWTVDRNDYVVLYTYGKLTHAGVVPSGDECYVSGIDVSTARIYQRTLDTDENNMDFPIQGGGQGTFRDFKAALRRGNFNGCAVYFVDFLEPNYKAYAIATMSDNTDELSTEDGKLYLRNFALMEDPGDYWVASVPNSTQTANLFSATGGVPTPGWEYVINSSRCSGAYRYTNFAHEGYTPAITPFATFVTDSKTPSLIALYEAYGTASEKYLGLFVKKGTTDAPTMSISCLQVPENISNANVRTVDWMVRLNSTGAAHCSGPGVQVMIDGYVDSVYRSDGTSFAYSTFCQNAKIGDRAYAWDYSNSSNPQYIGCGQINMVNSSILSVGWYQMGVK